MMKIIGTFGGFLKNKQGSRNILLSAAIGILISWACGLFGYNIPLEVAGSMGIVVAALGFDAG
tara:strand:+ start:2950 stop:3138 length:189 start_codon:yes stop_codon:yes gene_type:complete